MKIVLAGGGTAGHVFPALALAQRLRDEHGAEVSFVGGDDGPERELVPAAGFRFDPIRAVKLPRRPSFEALRAPVVARRSIGTCRPLVQGAAAVVGIGGYASAPAVLAARRARAPVVLVEPNAVPGLVNRLLARRARAIALTFPEARRRLRTRARIVLTGNPVRDEITRVPSNRPALCASATEAFRLEQGRTTVVVFGGSQGALHLDEVVAAATPLLADRGDLQLLVSTGPKHVGVVQETGDGGSGLVVRAVASIERMDLALAVSDVAVSRAGAGHLAELAVCGIPSILVPYPHAAEDHQTANAKALERAGAAEVISDGSLTAEVFARRVAALVGDPDRRDRMSAAAETWAVPDAVDRLARLVTETARGDS